MLESSTFWCSYLGLWICKLSTKIKYNIINLSCHRVHFIEQYIWRNLVDWTTTFHHFFRSELFFTPWAISPRRCSRRASPRSSTGLWPAYRPDRKSTVKPKLWPRRRGWDSGKIIRAPARKSLQRIASLAAKFLRLFSAIASSSGRARRRSKRSTWPASGHLGTERLAFGPFGSDEKYQLHKVWLFQKNL